MDESALAPLTELPPAESRAYLVDLARQEGIAALETLQLALEVPALAMAAVEALGEVSAQESWKLLERTAERGSSAALRKAARRAQHRLRSRGFIPAPEVRGRSAAPVEQARASFFDRSGGQFLRLVRPAHLGMVRYAGFILSPDGLEECLYLLESRADLQQLLDEEERRFGQQLVEMGLGYVARRVRQAAARNREQGRLLPEDYIDALQLLEDAPEDTSLEGIVAEATAVTDEEAHRLVRHRSMQGWLLDRDEVQPYLREWSRLLEVQPLWTPEGLLDLGALQTYRQISARIIGERIDEPTCRRFVLQLREQAALLSRMAEPALAAIALRCAAGLEQHPAVEDPFLHVLVGLSLEQALLSARQEAPQGPWVAVQGTGGPLWVPRPVEEEADTGKRSTPLWLPDRQE